MKQSDEIKDEPIRMVDDTVSSLKKVKAAVQIQRHFRGFSVRQRLGIQTRFKLLRVLSSPMPERKETAEQILKE